jgi:hypothetical protein
MQLQQLNKSANVEPFRDVTVGNIDSEDTLLGATGRWTSLLQRLAAELRKGRND